MNLRISLSRRPTLLLLFFFTILLLLVSVSIVARASLVRHFGDSPVGYSGPAYYALRYVEASGHIPSSADIYAPTPFSGGVFYSEGYPLALTLPAVVNLLVGDTQNMDTSLLFSLFVTIAFMAVAATFLFSKAPFGGSKSNYMTGLSCMVFLGFSNVTVFYFLGGTNAGIELIVILLCVKLMLRPITHPKVVSILILSLFILMFHFTAGLLFISLLLGLLVFAEYRYRTQNPSTSGFPNSTVWRRRMLGFASAFTAIYCGYVLVFYPSAAAPLSSFMIGIFDQAVSRQSYLGGIIADSSATFLVLNSLSLVLYSLVLTVILMWSWFSRRKLGIMSVFVVCMFLPLVWLAVGFFAWMGVYGAIQRISAYVVYPTVATISSTYEMGKRFAVLLFLVILIAVPLTFFIYVESPYNKGSYATVQEESVSQWIVMHSHEDDGVFTDLRLGGTLVARGHLYTAGIPDTGSSARTAPLICEYLFYSPSEESLRVGIELVERENGIRVDFLFVSDQMTSQFPAIRGYDYTFKPASVDFTTQYDAAVFLGRICDSGQSVLYSV